MAATSNERAQRQYTGRLADPEFRHQRAVTAARAAWGPDASIARLERVDLTDQQAERLRALLDQATTTRAWRRP
jgi:hypothetical protein